MIDKLLSDLQSEDAATVESALDALGGQGPTLGEEELDNLVQAVLGVFYVDTVDHPEFIPALEKAQRWLAGLGEEVIPALLANIEESDLKTDFWIASVLAKMGQIAVNPLLDACEGAEHSLTRTFALYSLGKIRDDAALAALSALFEALEDEDREVRDTATRALGKVCENVSAGSISEEDRVEIFGKLIGMVGDRYAGVRAKAFRSLGKMARLGYLLDSEKEQLAEAIAGALGEDEHNWDVAYVVRMEAGKARRHL